MESFDYSDISRFKSCPSEHLQYADKLISEFFEGKTLKYTILKLVWGELSYNYSLIIWNGKIMLWTRYGSVESNDGEYMPYLSNSPLFERSEVTHRNQYELTIKDFIIKNRIKLIAKHYPENIEPEEYPSNYKLLPLIDTLFLHASFVATFGDFSFRGSDSILEQFPQYIPLNKTSFMLAWGHVGRWNPKLLIGLFPVEPINIRCGIKLIPLKNIALKTDNPMFRPAGEIWCNKLTNLMITTNVAPCFAFYYGNKIVKNTDVHVYQNVAMYHMFESDRIIREREQELTLLYASRSPTGIEDQARKYNKLVELSGTSIMILMNNGGLAPIHFRNILPKMEELDSQMLFFEYIYGFYCLSLNGIIHNDPHMNNILIDNPALPNQMVHVIDFRIPHNSTMDEHLNDAIVYCTKLTKTQKDIVYGLNEHGEDINRPYTTPKDLGSDPELEEGYRRYFIYTLRYRARIIDFSRAVIVNPQASGWQKYHQEGFFQRAKTLVENLLKYANTATKLNALGPDVLFGYTYDELLNLAHEDIDVVFKCFEVLDLILFCRNWYDAEFGNKWMHSTAGGIYEDCRMILQYRMFLLKTDPTKLSLLDNPIPAIIAKYFYTLEDGTFQKQDGPSVKSGKERNLIVDPVKVLSIMKARKLQISHDVLIFGDQN
jgi:hypothetical protein